MNSLNNHGMITPHGALSPSGDLNTIVNVLTTLPTTQESIPNNFLNTPVAHIKQSIKDNTVNSEPINACLEGPNLFESVLSNLDKLKNRLGGSPNFYSTPTINMEDNSTTFFGIPMSAVKDWFRMTLVQEWKPQFFWESVAKTFNITRDNQFSQYEEAHLSIQRFMLLIANKTRFFEILDFKQEERTES